MVSKIANWVVWTALTLVVLFLAYKNTEWFKPAADKAIENVKAVVAKVPTGPFTKATVNEKLNGARDSYARGDVNAAVAAYTDVIKSNPKNVDARGELGNIYYATGRLPEATQSYYDAAKLLLDNKELDRVDALLPVIAQFNPMMADELAQKLNEAMGGVVMPPPAPDQYRQQAPQSALTHH
jgi:tetratricopeptide (TPR) repeat protein